MTLVCCFLNTRRCIRIPSYMIVLLRVFTISKKQSQAAIERNPLLFHFLISGNFVPLIEELATTTPDVSDLDSSSTKQ